jgi:hypothetical protein
MPNARLLLVFSDSNILNPIFVCQNRREKAKPFGAGFSLLEESDNYITV